MPETGSLVRFDIDSKRLQLKNAVSFSANIMYHICDKYPFCELVQKALDLNVHSEYNVDNYVKKGAK